MTLCNAVARRVTVILACISRGILGRSGEMILSLYMAIIRLLLEYYILFLHSQLLKNWKEFRKELHEMIQGLE